MNKINKYLLKEALSFDPIESESLGNINSFALLQKFVKVNLINDENNVLTYQASINDIIDSDIKLEDLIQLRNSGWGINEEKNVIFKQL